MQVAIAVHEGEFSANGQFKKMRIVSCSDPSMEGLRFCIFQWVEFGRHYIVKFCPDDQFCRVVPLADALLSLESAGAV